MYPRYYATSDAGRHASATLLGVCLWQAQTRGAHALVGVRADTVEPLTVDVDGVTFDGEAVGVAVRAVRALLAARCAAVVGPELGRAIWTAE